jgi:hypothetical protein
MSDSYQAIYDAMRSRISGGNIGEAVDSALRSANIGHYCEMAFRAVQQATSEYERPSAVFRPALTRDGDHWCALYGDDLVRGVSGFGKSPAEAMWAFDTAWHEKIKQADAESPGTS